MQIQEPYYFADVIKNIEKNHSWTKCKPVSQLPAPIYNYSLATKLQYTGGLGLTIKRMEDHMTNEGHEIFKGLQYNGYLLAGAGLDINRIDYNEIIDRYISLRKHPPTTVILNDKREWDRSRDQRNQNAHFTRLAVLHNATATFKINIVKDSQSDALLHQQSADEVLCHGWIIYYNEAIVTYLAPYLRPEHLVRTYHSVDSDNVPEFRVDNRKNLALLSGAISKHYPLRTKIRDSLNLRHHRRHTGLNKIDLLSHPGYSNVRCHTNEYLQTLATYKVSICTSSVYGYALRKIIESVACGCIVITDLPVDECLPVIDDALIRIHPDIDMLDLQKIVNKSIESWDEDKQRFYAERAKLWYDYRAITYRLSFDIESLRLRYSNSV